MSDSFSSGEALRAAAEANPGDARALGAYAAALDAAGRDAEALPFWEKAARADRAWALPWRKLGSAYFNAGDNAAAKGALQRAFTLEPTAEVLRQRDELWRATSALPRERLEELEQYVDIVRQDDALRIAAAELLNIAGRFPHAQGLLLEGAFAPAHAAAALTQYRRAQIALLRQALWRGEETRAAWAALAEIKPPFSAAAPARDDAAAHEAERAYWLALACRRAQDLPAASLHWDKSCVPRAGDEPAGVATFYAGLALRELARATEAERAFDRLEKQALHLRAGPAGDDGPAPRQVHLLFREDPAGRRAVESTFLEALARYGLREVKIARRLLGDVLRDDPNHSLAADFMTWLEWQP